MELSKPASTLHAAAPHQAGAGYQTAARRVQMMELPNPAYHTPAQFVGHWRLLNVFFGSPQTEHWLQRYGHFKFREIEAFQN